MNQTILGAALGAFAGGILLNLMPCVFPVLGIKISSLLRQNHGGSLRAAGLWYMAGTLCTTLALALTLFFLREGGRSIGWGFQLQSAAFVGGMALVFSLMGCHLLGWFTLEFPARLIPQSLAGHAGSLGEFCSGVLSVLVATPCSAPFMAPAIGFALSQGLPANLAVFGALGTGVALPFVALCFFPRLARALPRPGRWMDTFKQFLAFPMFAGAIWLFWVFSRQTDSTHVLLLCLTLFLACFLMWVARIWSASPRRLVLAVLSALNLAFAAAVLQGSALAPSVDASPTARDPSVKSALWLPFSPGLVKELRAQRRIVFIDFTADWCLSCKANEKAVFSSQEVMDTLRKFDVALVKADWTNEDPAITAALAEFGRSSVPLYLLYHPGSSEATVLPQILTPGIFLEAFHNAIR